MTYTDDPWEQLRVKPEVECKALTADGRRCRCKACIGGMCIQHYRRNNC